MAIGRGSAYVGANAKRPVRLAPDTQKSEILWLNH
jgi:hypothetical protein